MQLIKDLRDVTGALKELVADDERHEEDAKLELAVSAQRFSQETRDVVDDKLSFSATLMRAGEVHAAKRLLAEVEAEVRDNEAALLEQVNEVKVVRAARRERITRMRLARSLAVAMLGAAVMATSAAGMAFASFLEDRARIAEAAEVRRDRNRSGSEGPAAAAGARTKQTKDSRRNRVVTVGGVQAALTAEALAAFEQLKSGDVEAGEIERLLSLLPADLADTMRDALSTAQVAQERVKDALPALVDRPSVRRKAAKAQQAAADEADKEGAAEEPKEEASPDPEPEPTEGGETEEEPEDDPDDTMGLPGLGG
ncbi:MAG TPA: hypothetical protein VEU29_04915 [Actinomycetota bacterium]|nr:hypothetical protein [Actinomycetota bacterium]